MTRKAGSIVKASLWTCIVQLWPLTASAQTNDATNADGLFRRAVDSDWAYGWLEAIFRGAALPPGMADGATQLAQHAAALRSALSVFSIGMLVIAGMLVAYHVVSLVVETAHSGVPMGKRTNQFWAPIRFVLAIGLLVPIGSGLNTGQYALVKFAEAGSALASNAWRASVDMLKGSVGSYVTPRGPDLARLVAVATEMEICRSLYKQVYAGLQPDMALSRIGDMGEAQKIPLSRLSPETWRYSNALHADAPLCGEYRFTGHKSGVSAGDSNDETNSLPKEWADFAQADAERLIMQTRMLAERVAPSFLLSTVTANDVSGNLTLLMQEQQKTVDAKLKAMTLAKMTPADLTLTGSSSAGWLAAGFFVGDVVRRQTILGELASTAIPSVQAPVFGHKALKNSMIAEAAANDPALRNLQAGQLEKVYGLYGQVAEGMKRARAWLYRRQIAEGELIAPDTLDLDDQVGPVTDSMAGASMFNRLLGSAMATHGVWTDPTRNGGMRPSFAAFMRDMSNNPIAGLAEIGRRYHAFGSYALSMAGPGLAEPNVMGSAALFALTGIVFSLAGLALLFVAPLLPLFRFFLGVLVWLLAVFEAVVTLPLVAVAHLTPSGEGLSGPVAKQAYWLWLSLFMRPLLTLLGFVVGLVALIVSLTLLNSLFVPLTNALYSAHGDVFVSVRSGLALFYAVMALALVNASFKGIDWLPATVLRWLSPGDGASPTGMTALQFASGPQSILPGAANGDAGHGGATSRAKTFVVGSRAAEKASGDPAAAAARAHGLKSALMPAYREPVAEAVVIGDKEGVAVGLKTETTESGRTGTTAAAAAVSGGDKATAIASATAHASAVAMERQLPLPDKPTPADIEKALEKLSRKLDKRESVEKTDKKETSDKKETRPEDSREQSSAPPEDDKPS